jgi:hypothetical protein
MFAVLNQAAPPQLDRASASAGAAPVVPASGREPGPAPAASQAARTVTPERATTVDALFAPLQAAESRGAAWLFDGNALKMLPLRLGVTDGMFTEVLNGSDVPPDAKVVVSMTTGLEQKTAGQTRTSSPLMGQQPGRGGAARPR